MMYTLTGNNSFALQAELRRLVADFVTENGDMAVEKIDGEEAEYEKITEAIQSLPFLSSKKLIILRAPSGQKKFIENFEHIIESIPETNDVVIVEPKPDKRTAYYKMLQKKTQFQVFDDPSSQTLPTWLVNRAKAAGGTLTNSDASYLVERIGPNQQQLAQELDKLVTYNPNISRKNIDLLTVATPQSTIFQLMERAFRGDHKRSLALYAEQRRLKVEPQAVIGLLAWQLHVLALVKTAGERDVATIAREANVSPFVVQKSISIVRGMSMTDIKRLVRDLRRLDVRLKSQAIDADEALQHYLLTMTN